MNPHQKPQEDVVVTQEDADLEAWFLRRMPDNAAWRGHIARLLARHRLLGHEAGRRDMREAAGWQPIETAPRNCEPILVWTGYSHEIVYECWQDDEGGPVWFNGDVTIDEPTHWMPPPLPPALPTEPLGGEG